MQLSKIFLCTIGIVALSITTTMAKTIRYSCGEHTASLTSEDCTTDIDISVHCSVNGVTTSINGEKAVHSCSGKDCNVTSVLCDLCPKETPYQVFKSGSTTDWICCEKQDDENINNACCPRGQATKDKKLCCTDPNPVVIDNVCCPSGTTEVAYTNNKASHECCGSDEEAIIYNDINGDEMCCPSGTSMVALAYNGLSRTCCKSYEEIVPYNYGDVCCPTGQKATKEEGTCCEPKKLTNDKTTCCSDEQVPVDKTDGKCCPANQITKDRKECCSAGKRTTDSSKCCSDTETPSTKTDSELCCKNSDKETCDGWKQYGGWEWNTENCKCECPDSKKYGYNQCCKYDVDNGSCCERNSSGNRTGNDIDGNSNSECCVAAGGFLSGTTCCSKDNPGKTLGGTSDSNCTCPEGKSPSSTQPYDFGDEVRKIQEDKCNNEGGLCCPNTRPGLGGLIKTGGCCLTKECQCEHANGEMVSGTCCV